MWLYIGLIGASALAAGLVQWFYGDPRLPWSPIVALFGAVVAVASWRRAFTVLEQVEGASTVGTNASSESTLRVLQSDRTRGQGPAVSHPAAIES
jgi:hypothetical protein